MRPRSHGAASWRLWLAFVSLVWAGAACAQPVSGPDLVRELTDKTLSGFNGSLWFSEFHAPDGRVLGHNGGVPNQDSCWKVRGDAVCYYYPRHRRGEQRVEGEFCWRFERAGPQGYKITSVGSQLSGVARLEPGNPQGHSDQGQPWTCDAAISRHDPSRHALFSVAAADAMGQRGLSGAK